MSKALFKSYDQGETLLFPVSLDDKISQDSPVRLISKIVDKLDITAVLDTYIGGGTTGYHPRMLLKVLFYAYMNNIYSCRKISGQLQENIHYMWLSGSQTPDFRTVNNFRSLHLKDTVHDLFTQVVTLLVEMGYLSIQTVYVDGTKLESRANRYTFVWRKTVERNKAKLEEKIRSILKLIEEGIAADNQPDDDPPIPVDSKELMKRIAEINSKNLDREAQRAVKELQNKHLPKLEEYEGHLEIMGVRNSYSKTDENATFMRMKDDHLQNGQLKPAYNLQIGTEHQFIVHYDLFPNAGDTLTLRPLMQKWKERYGRMPEKLCADAGYGSEANYGFMEEEHIEAYVKYNYYDMEKRKSFRENISVSQNLYYNEKEDYFVCPMGQHMKHAERTVRINERGCESTIDIYQAERCEGCPLRGACHKASGNRQIEINHKLRYYKRQAAERLASVEGIAHMKKRSIEPEAVFGQMKYNRQYSRFRHFGKDTVKMDFAIFAIAFNLGKMTKKRSDKTGNPNNSGNPSNKAEKSYNFALIITSVRIAAQQSCRICPKSGRTNLGHGSRYRAA
ncbi:MAG: IS1182 family transposase [Prevotellaceae bacterium]|jgi:transposase|nr:IS1182 family transposase [Prevotellaceae bacterium]